jgi:hypothetical protein
MGLGAHVGAPSPSQLRLHHLLLAASVGNRAPRVLSQAGAPLFWTSERADTHFVCERARKTATNSASLSERSEQFTRSERGVLPRRATN